MRLLHTWSKEPKFSQFMIAMPINYGKSISISLLCIPFIYGYSNIFLQSTAYVFKVLERDVLLCQQKKKKAQQANDASMGILNTLSTPSTPSTFNNVNVVLPR